MSEQRFVSRRASLKGLGAMGAVMAFGRAAAAQAPAEPKRPRSDQGKPAVNVVDLAVDRFSKGHS